ncbi:MAG: pyridoxamine 5'-phosphate oxidase family protein [Methylobacteriaceae bacterium]|nr:pyridoxamine 5'-phosphate oxidase family protein [Methylobacteriaceae bacterium]
MTTITSIEQLDALYGKPGTPSLVKEVDHITPHYRAFIEASPFCAVATSGPEGLDCSPRGDRAGFVRIADERTLLLPDRRGNNRTDSLKNIIGNPHVGVLFLVPGCNETLRVNGRAHLSIAPDLLESFAVEEKAPRSVMVIAVDTVYFQCARALLRSELWNPQKHVDRKSLPTAGEILAALSQQKEGGAEYDRAWNARAKETLW